MRKRQFLFILKSRLSGLPEQEVSERINFYSEIIDDKIEEGMTEEEAVAEIGPVSDIVSQIVSDTPSEGIAHEKPKRKAPPNVAVILLLALGSPIWLSLAIAAFAVLLSLYATLWSVIISLWAVFASLAACGVGGALAGVVFAVSGKGAVGLAIIGAGFVLAGLAIFVFFGCRAATEGVIKLTKTITLRIINRFNKKEIAQ